MPSQLITFVETLRTITSLLGVIVIAIGVGRGVYDLFIMLNQALQRKRVQVQKFLDHIMKAMIIGLDFFLAGDIILTVVVPTADKLIALGGIVLIRIVLEYFLIHIRNVHFSK